MASYYCDMCRIECDEAVCWQCLSELTEDTFRRQHERAVAQMDAQEAMHERIVKFHEEQLPPMRLRVRQAG